MKEDYFYYYLGMAYYERKKYDEALSSYKKAEECAKEEFQKEISKVYNAIGIVYEDKGDLEQARQYYEKSVQYKNLFFDGLYNMALLLHKKLNKPKESVYWYEQAVMLSS